MQNSSNFDYSKTLFLPNTSFSMRAALPQKEPEIGKFWQEMDLYKCLRAKAKDKPRYVLHDGPPYANGNLHIGHALNKILKDVIVKSKQMAGYNSALVPGWDCHGLPIEWKVEEEYRSQGKKKDDVAINEFRANCRKFAAHWVAVQSAQFQRFGVIGNFANPYLTMDFATEAMIAQELLFFAKTKQLYRGSKPVMWSVAEKTALAEAEIEYHEHESDSILVKFKILNGDFAGAYIVIWTTTPWTIPANRAVCYNNNIDYALFEVVETENDFGPQIGEKLIFADKLAEECAQKAKLKLQKIGAIDVAKFAAMELQHPFAHLSGYDFIVPMLLGEHVTAEAGTGFVHTAPSHGRDDFEVWVKNRALLEQKNIDSSIPFPVDDEGFYTSDVPEFGSMRAGGALRVLDEKGKKGNANAVIIEQLIAAQRLFARGRIKHSYPHSWRSKTPLISRNTPQWFISIDKELVTGKTLRETALDALQNVQFTPANSSTRLSSMLKDRPDWVLSRQRTWGVPICIFANEKGEILQDEAVNARIIAAFKEEGADAWFADGARARFLLNRAQEDWVQIMDILDVWFDSGCSYNFVLRQREELSFPADLYFEGSDQHRGWFQSSLLESCVTTGIAPYKQVLTHGFTIDEKGKKMSKSLGNVVDPQKICEKFGADILRLWVMTSDYCEDQRVGDNIIQMNVDYYRKLRNVIRWMLGTLSHYEGEDVEYEALPELEKYMLHRLAKLDSMIKDSYGAFDFKKIIHSLLDFSIVDLSAFYFDIRKDALYCDAPSSLRRKAALATINKIFDYMIRWLAPMLSFTSEEAWQERYKQDSIHLQEFLTPPAHWRNEAIELKWKKVRKVRKVVTGALEQARAEKLIGSSLEAAPVVYVEDLSLQEAMKGLNMADICITSDISILSQSAGPASALFMLEDVPKVAVKIEKAKGNKCMRSWRYSLEVGQDPEYPDVCARDAAALRELKALKLSDF